MFFQVCENGKRVKVMMVDLIEKIYSFLWGDLVHIPLPGGRNFAVDHSTDPGGNLFYDPDAFSADSSVSGYGKSTG